MPSPLIPTPAYRDTARAVDFLVTAFGFERHAVHEDDDGRLVHVELRLGDAMVMPATVDQGDYGRRLTGVADAGRPTGGFYVVVDDVASHHRRAVAAGAEILSEPRQREHGNEYLCRDPGGHLWTFGTYDPWG